MGIDALHIVVGIAIATLLFRSATYHVRANDFDAVLRAQNVSLLAGLNFGRALGGIEVALAVGAVASVTAPLESIANSAVFGACVILGCVFAGHTLRLISNGYSGECGCSRISGIVSLWTLVPSLALVLMASTAVVVGAGSARLSGLGRVLAVVQGVGVALLLELLPASAHSNARTVE